MNCANVSLYSPYGAYELKARYQRNLLTATLLVVALVMLLLGAFYAFGLNESAFVPKPPRPAGGSNPTVISIERPKTQVPGVQGQRQRTPSRDGIPKPVVDDSIPDELDVLLPTNDERGMRIYGIDTGSGDGVGWPDGSTDDGGVIYTPPPDTFIVVEIVPEMIHEEKPEYPRMARRMGQEGKVWIKVLLDIDGTVMDAIVAKPTGMTLLEEAALKAAYKNRFSPAIQNGRPVRIWVTYSVHFYLTSDSR